ncbi:hypothetical protein B0H14DRAFT_3699340 [Mycena olivaceomarginata]|nr:hypothetical protein B0H14DRAFT_3699340 [Mycena olivaceomarginata]
MYETASIPPPSRAWPPNAAEQTSLDVHQHRLASALSTVVLLTSLCPVPISTLPLQPDSPGDRDPENDPPRPPGRTLGSADPAEVGDSDEDVQKAALDFMIRSSRQEVAQHIVTLLNPRSWKARARQFTLKLLAAILEHEKLHTLLDVSLMQKITALAWDSNRDVRQQAINMITTYLKQVNISSVVGSAILHEILPQVPTSPKLSGADASKILEVEFVFEPEFIPGLDPPQTEPSASAAQENPAKSKLSVTLLCLRTTAVSSLYTGLEPTNPTPERMAAAVASLEIAWPRDGTLFLDMNHGGSNEKSWLPYEIDPSSPLDVTSFIQPGVNIIRLIQLTGMTDRTFILYASCREAEPAFQIFDYPTPRCADSMFNFSSKHEREEQARRSDAAGNVELYGIEAYHMHTT